MTETLSWDHEERLTKIIQTQNSRTEQLRNFDRTEGSRILEQQGYLPYIAAKAREIERVYGQDSKK